MFALRFDFASVVRLVGLLALLAAPASATEPTVSKGHRILLERGLQLQGMVANHDLFHLDTFLAAEYTTAHWIWSSSNAWLGNPPGIPWARWIGSEADMPFSPADLPYADTLVALQLSDEQNLNDPAVRANMAVWYANVRDRFPNVILYCNSYGGQLTNPSLADFIQTSRPDMLSFDTYPFGPDRPAYGSPTNLYGDMQRYRKFALANGLPYAMYTQTFHDYITRNPSESELRLNYFAGVAFGYTYFNTFTYNTGATSLFDGPGDTNPTPTYYQLAEIHRRLRRLGPTLTRLVNTDARFINGKHLDGGTPVANPTPIDVLNWTFNVNDPYLRGWVITNLGTTNDGQPGDVWLSWFKPLHECFDGPDHDNEIYLMVTNGLTDRNGSAADCRQQIKLNFLFGTAGITSLQRLNQQTGTVEVMELVLLPNTGGRRQLVFEFDGGTAELFKFNTGAPFVGVPDAEPPGTVTAFSAAPGHERVTLRWTNPTDYDFTGTLIRRKAGGVPEHDADGEFVVDRFGLPGTSDSFTDTTVAGGVTYGYAAFSHDRGPHYAAAVNATSTPRARGDMDFNDDDDVDLLDFATFVFCLNGPNRAMPVPACFVADANDDGDVDLSDFSAFAACFNGYNRPPACVTRGS